MARLKINADGDYRGLNVYKDVNKNIKEHINFYKEQTKYYGSYKGSTIIDMLNELESALRLELE